MAWWQGKSYILAPSYSSDNSLLDTIDTGYLIPSVIVSVQGIACLVQ